MITVNIYLNFEGNCEEAFNFYKSAFGGEFDYIGRYKEMPPQEGMPPFPKEFDDKIMHISLPISKETIIMGSDTVGEWAKDFIRGNNFSISIRAENKEETDRLFKLLSVGGKVTMPLQDTFWGEYFGMFADKFGINWMVSFNPQHK